MNGKNLVWPWIKVDPLQDEPLKGAVFNTTASVHGRESPTRVIVDISGRAFDNTMELDAAAPLTIGKCASVYVTNKCGWMILAVTDKRADLVCCLIFQRARPGEETPQPVLRVLATFSVASQRWREFARSMLESPMI
jgi:hypothetical protein